MTPKEIKALVPDTPIDGRIVEYWRIESADDDYPIHYICRFNLNTPWEEHPRGKADPRSKGADFVDDWSIWVESLELGYLLPGELGVPENISLTP